MADQRLEGRMVNKAPLAIVFHQQIRGGIVHSQDLCVARLHLPCRMRPPIGVGWGGAPGDFFRAPRHFPRQHAAGDVGDQSMVSLLAQGVA